MMGSIGGYARRILHVDLWEWDPDQDEIARTRARRRGFTAEPNRLISPRRRVSYRKCRNLALGRLIVRVLGETRRRRL